jgi:hypothetical protein
MMYQLHFCRLFTGKQTYFTISCHFLHTLSLPTGTGYVRNRRYSMKQVTNVQTVIFNSVDRFTVLPFIATGAPLAERRIRILPMNQHAWWPITFDMKGINFWTAWQHYVSRRAVRFMRGSLFMTCQQQAAVISSISHLFSVTVSELCGTSWCCIL